MGGRVIKCPPPPARAQSQLSPFISLIGVCSITAITVYFFLARAWSWALNESTVQAHPSSAHDTVHTALRKLADSLTAVATPLVAPQAHGPCCTASTATKELLALHDRDADGFLSQRELSVRPMSMISGARVTMTDGSAALCYRWRACGHLGRPQPLLQPGRAA
jgi:hypothetical protein